MPKSEARQLRIFCICGQKMKVSPGMYGRPGKCVACRQKILIPHPDDLPPDTEEVHLKDHPEFLRKSKAPAVPTPEPEPPDLSDDAPNSLMALDGAVKISVPLDVLEPLRVLCSLSHLINTKLKKGDLTKDDYDALRRKDVRVRAALEDLEEELRQRLMETAIELTSVQEGIAELALGVRVGEMALKPYRERIEKQRRRRDLLERRQENLRGWLSVDDPELAGGLMNVPLDAIPDGPFRIPMTLDIEKIHTLLDWHVDALRQAMEAKTAVASTNGNGSVAKADVARARAEIQYRRGRLEEHKNDLAQDLRAVEAQLDHLRGRIQAGEITREQFDEGERELVRIKSDLTKAKSLVARALAAESPEEVPRPRGTFIDRMARVGMDTTDNVDRWLARSAAMFLIVALFTPGPENISLLGAAQRAGGQSGAAFVWVVVPILSTLMLLVVSVLRPRERRGLIELGAWFVVATTMGIAWHEAQYGAGPVSAWLRLSGPIPTQLFQLIFGAGLLLWFAAAFAAFAPFPRMRFLPMAIGSTTLAILMASATDVGGLLAPSAKVDAVWLPQPETGAYRVEVSLHNTGGRALHVDDDSTAANAVVFTMLRSAQMASGTSAHIVVEPTDPGFATNETLPAGQMITAEYALDPGTYLASVTFAGSGTPIDQFEFTLEAIEPEPEEQAPAPMPADQSREEQVPNETDPVPPGETATPPASDSGATPLPRSLLEMHAPQVEFLGALNAPGKDPRFIIHVSVPNGRTRKEPLKAHDEIYDGWSITEYNLAEQTITISKGEVMLILRTGDKIFLTTMPQPAS